jgi:hypothetical protein
MLVSRSISFYTGGIAISLSFLVFKMHVPIFRPLFQKPEMRYTVDIGNKYGDNANNTGMESRRG